MFDVLGSFFSFSADAFGWPVNVESGSCEAIDPFEINLEVVDGCGDEHVELARIGPVSPFNWRRIRWLKRMGYSCLSR